MYCVKPRIVALALGVAAQPAIAAGDLLVAPTRVILDGARGTEVILNNIGAQPATYRISLELRRMDASGQLVDVTPESATPKEQAVLAMITYAPRRVVLPPNQPQAIRIGARFAADLPDGEYRAHMLFRAIPDAVPVVTAPSEVRQGLSIALTPIYGVTIPIIVRKGALKVTAALSDAHMARIDPTTNAVVADPKAPGAQDALVFSMTRSGDRSTYGRIRVTRAGLAKPVIEVRGIAAYAEITRRNVVLPVPPEVAAQLHGAIKVEYLEDIDTGGALIAQTDAVLR